MNPDTFYAQYLSAQAELIEKVQKQDKDFFHENYVLYKSNDSGKLIKLKYKDRCRFTDHWQKACRGSMFLQHGNELHCYFSLNKFFNSHEFEKHYGLCYEKMLTALSLQGYKFLYMTKHDGTCVQCFTDHCGTRHRLTLGSLNDNLVGASGRSTKELVDACLKEQFPSLVEFLDENPGVSLICELITPYNVIKTKYNFGNSIAGCEASTSSRCGFIKPIVLINRDGVPTWQQLGEHCSDFDFTHMPTDCWHFDASTHEEVLNIAFTAQESNPELYGENPEGVVAYCYKVISKIEGVCCAELDATTVSSSHVTPVVCADEQQRTCCFPIAKLKRPQYLRDKSTFGVLDPTELQRLKLSNQLDDVLLNREQTAHVVEFSDYLDRMAAEFSTYHWLKERLPIKEFALQVNSLPHSTKTVYAASLMALHKSGFPFWDTDEYQLVVELLQLETRGVSRLDTLQQKNGVQWFRYYKPGFSTGQH